MLPPHYGSRPPMLPARPPMTALRRRMRDALQLRHYSDHTIRASLHCVAACARHFHTSPDRLGPEHVRTYQLYVRDHRIPTRGRRRSRRLVSLAPLAFSSGSGLISPVYNQWC